MIKHIEVKGARENNLKNVNIKIPKDALTVVTGVSGSGKSSLVYDVIFSEGQRRYLESVGTYAKRFTPMLKKPDVDFVFGLSPVLAIEQKKGIRNPRSTVGTMTDISDYLRLLFAILGSASCPFCGEDFQTRTTNQITERILSLPQGSVIEIYALVSKIYDESYAFLFEEIRKKGYRKVRIDGTLHDLSKKIEIDDQAEYTLEVLADRFVVKESIYRQLTGAIEEALIIGGKFLRFEISGEGITDEIRERFYHNFGCREHQVVVGELHPFYFTPNDAESSCDTCRGIGTYRRALPYLVVEHKNKSIKQGALTNTFVSVKHPFKYMLLYSLAQHYGFSLDIPFKDLPKEAQDIIFYGTKGTKVRLVAPPDSIKKSPEEGKMISYSGLINEINQRYKEESRKGRAEYTYDFLFKKHMAEDICPDCKGTKLKKNRLLIRIDGKNIYDLCELPVDELLDFIQNIEVSSDKRKVADQIIAELVNRLKLLCEIGVHYINLNRRADSISGGEAQRIRMSAQISTGLSGMLYILDEPSIGLHPRDGHRIINTMKQLRDAGNTVIVVEHDLDTIKEADYVVEVGPEPGEKGGEITAKGTVDEIKEDSRSITGSFLSGRRKIEIPSIRRKGNGQFITIKGAREHNLKNVAVEIPLGMLVCVTGVSGSGKSSLINGILYKKLHALFQDPRIIPGEHDALEGFEGINHMINIDQSPIGKSSRSNPATYVGIFDRIRDLFADTQEARAKGFEHSFFSANNKYGRCDECAGSGIIVTELQFMPDVETVCPVCKGTGFSNDILEVHYKGKNINEVLNMSVSQAIDFFEDQKYLAHKLKVMDELGLGYVKLGQHSSTLSGGEAQRIKLAYELAKIKKGSHNLYILDEPTTGLHCSDIQRLLDCINRLVDAGHTVLVIEHHLDVIKCADHIIDMGPEAGKKGGYVVASGTPEEVAQVEGSFTGQYLRQVL